MKICASHEKKRIYKHYYCTRMIFSTGRRARYMHIHVKYIYYLYSICIHVYLLLLSLLLLS